jgi:hypothetical protein
MREVGRHGGLREADSIENGMRSAARATGRVCHELSIDECFRRRSKNQKLKPKSKDSTCKPTTEIKFSLEIEEIKFTLYTM